MVVVVPQELHKVLLKEAKKRDRSLVWVNRTILSAWANQHRGYEPVEILDGRTKEARDSLFSV